MKGIVIFCTVGSMENASDMAHALIEAREAACVNIIHAIRSIYRWAGKTCDDAELLMLIKTSEEKFEAVRSRIRQMHSYELPEVIALPIVQGDHDYLRWLSSSVAGS